MGFCEYECLEELYREIEEQEMYSTEPGWVQCTECGRQLPEDYPTLRLPHVCAYHMDEDVLVCSDECEQDWCDNNHETIDEYMESRK